MERRIARAAAATALNQLVVPLPQNRTLGRSVGRSVGRTAIFRREEREGREVKIRFVLCDAEEQDQPRVGGEGKGKGLAGRPPGRKRTPPAVKNEDVSDL